MGVFKEFTAERYPLRQVKLARRVRLAPLGLPVNQGRGWRVSLENKFSKRPRLGDITLCCNLYMYLLESLTGECLLLFLSLPLPRSRSLSLLNSLSLSALGLLLRLRCFSFLESFGDLLLFLSRTFSFDRLSVSLSRLGDLDLAIVLTNTSSRCDTASCRGTGSQAVDHDHLLVLVPKVSQISDNRPFPSHLRLCQSRSGTDKAPADVSCIP